MPEPTAFDVAEQSTGTYTATIVGNDGVTPLTAAQLSTLTLTLYVIKADGTLAYVNARNAQNVLNLNNVTVSAGGILVWTFQIADTTLVETLPFERHLALFAWTWAGGAGLHKLVLVVKRMIGVP